MKRSLFSWLPWLVLGALTMAGLPALSLASLADSPPELGLGTAAVLGAIQGATEFLPVSSSGHLSLGQVWLGVDPSVAGHRFNIVVHAGTLLAVVWVYRRDVWALLRVLTRPTVASDDRQRLSMMLVASLPLGVVLIPEVERAVIAMESSPTAIGLALWGTAAILFFAFRGQSERQSQPDPAPPKAWQALSIGFAQLLAVMPGVSRSGSTIAAGLAVGLDRTSAARFSFLISLIAIGGASAKETLDVLSDPASESIAVVPFSVGFVTSLVVGLLSLRGLLYLVNKGRVGVFVVYLAIVGGLAIALDLIG